MISDFHNDALTVDGSKIDKNNFINWEANSKISFGMCSQTKYLR